MTVAALAVPAGAGAASTVTIGNVTPPSNSTGAVTCPTPPPDQILAANTENGFVPAYVVPGGDGALLLTQWQLNATGATAGAHVTLVVMSIDFTAGTVSVVGTDTETLNPVGLPADGVETFTPATPIEVQPGDVIALYLGGATGIPCYWTGASSDDAVCRAGGDAGAGGRADHSARPAGAGTTASNAALNLAATLTPLSYDAAAVDVRRPVERGRRTARGADRHRYEQRPVRRPITLTDTVPAGLTVDYAAAASGSCAVSGSTCHLPVPEPSPSRGARTPRRSS